MIKFYVTDWEPNGCNSLVVMRNGKVLDVLDQCLFGIDVNKLSGEQVYLDPIDEAPIFRVSIKLIKKHVASGPFGFGFPENCKALSRYLK